MASLTCHVTTLPTAGQIRQAASWWGSQEIRSQAGGVTAPDNRWCEGGSASQWAGARAKNWDPQKGPTQRWAGGRTGCSPSKGRPTWAPLALHCCPISGLGPCCANLKQECCASKAVMQTPSTCLGAPNPTLHSNEHNTMHDLAGTRLLGRGR